MHQKGTANSQETSGLESSGSLPHRHPNASQGQMGRFRAAVLFPWDPALMAFYELYSLGPALLLPRKERGLGLSRTK